MGDELTRESAPKRRRWRWHLNLGDLPLCAVAIAAIVGAVIVWPGDLSWALVGVAAVAVIGASGWEGEIDFR